mmetsp:Transcript_26920/g.45114  ORF Transcript_26920/g.45114 Transcript_26920/m.45114 type:complete len:424 (-) Transcript_26920:947-2218(-)
MGMSLCPAVVVIPGLHADSSDIFFRGNTWQHSQGGCHKRNKRARISFHFLSQYFYFFARMVCGILHVVVDKANKLKDFGILGAKLQPFVRLTVGNVAVKTKAHPDKKEPKWEESFDINVTDDIQPPRLKIEVFTSPKDGDKKSEPKLVGSCILQFDKMAVERRTMETWFPLKRPDEPHAGQIYVKMTFTLDEAYAAKIAEEERLKAEKAKGGDITDKMKKVKLWEMPQQASSMRILSKGDDEVKPAARGPAGAQLPKLWDMQSGAPADGVGSLSTEIAGASALIPSEASAMLATDEAGVAVAHEDDNRMPAPTPGTPPRQDEEAETPAQNEGTPSHSEDGNNSTTAGSPGMSVQSRFQWEYKWAEDGELFGPFGTADMQDWASQGFFKGESVALVRQVPTPGGPDITMPDFILSDTIDFDKYD